MPSRGTNWMATRRMEIAYDEPNTALLYMVHDMADLSREPRLRQIITLYLATTTPYSFRGLVDEKSEFVLPSRKVLARLDDYQRWLLHACGPSHFPLQKDDRASMLSPTEHHGLSLTHQLFAICVLRQRRILDKDSDALVDTLCERVAAEAVWALRVTDLYIQRVAVLLMAGRPDLVKRKWVERILAWQQENGGWKYTSYSWSPRLEIDLRHPEPNAHTTIQGVWVAHMLKYRYRQWSEKNFR